MGLGTFFRGFVNELFFLVFSIADCGLGLLFFFECYERKYLSLKGFRNKIKGVVMGYSRDR